VKVRKCFLLVLSHPNWSHDLGNAFTPTQSLHKGLRYTNHNAQFQSHPHWVRLRGPHSHRVNDNRIAHLATGATASYHSTVM